MKAVAWWRMRGAYERNVVVLAAAVAALLLAAVLVWLPLERSRARVAEQLPQLRASVLEMRAQAAEVRALRSLPEQAVSATPLVTLVASGNLAQGLPGARLSLLDPKRARLAFDDASWTTLVEWLASVQTTHGLVVDEATVEALAAAGRVRGEIRLAMP